MRFSHSLLLAPLLLVGCFSPTEPTGPSAPSGLVAATEWEPGTLVAPELVQPIRGLEARRTVVRVTIALLDARPEAGGERLPDTAAVIADPRLEGAVKTPSPELVEGRAWHGDAARAVWEQVRTGDSSRWAVLFDGEDLAAESGATWFVARAADRSVAFAVERDGAELRVALERHAEEGERAKLALPLPGEGAALLAVVPTPFVDGRGAWCALWLETRLLAEDDRDRERWRDRATRLAFERNARIADSAAPEKPDPDAEFAWSGLPIDGSGRRALAWWTERHRDTLVADLALVATDEVLTDLLGRIAAPRLYTSDDSRIAVLEKQAWRLAAARDADDSLPDELRAAALRRGGVVGTDSAAMEELAKTPGGLKELQARLAEENRVALESSSASERVRAFDWLTARGLAPAGYLPLAPSAERRKELAADTARQASAEPERRDG